MKLIFLIIIVFFEGCLTPQLKDTTLDTITAKIILGYGASIYSIYGIFLISDTTTKLKDSIYGPIIFSILGIFALFIMLYYNIIPLLLNSILDDPNSFLILSLTIVLLGATLALLAFTYTMVLEKEEKDKKSKMRKNGEYFFVSTIFSILFLTFLFIFSVYCNQTNILSLPMNLLNTKFFITLNCFIILLLLVLISLCYTAIYLIIGLKSSINILPLNF